jgi:hypothetical protein
MQEALGANGAGAELQEERNEGEMEMEMAGNSSGLGRSSVVRAESAGRQVGSSQRWSGPPGCAALQQQCLDTAPVRGSVAMTF